MLIWGSSKTLSALSTRILSRSKSMVAGILGCGKAFKILWSSDRNLVTESHHPLRCLKPLDMLYCFCTISKLIWKIVHVKML